MYRITRCLRRLTVALWEGLARLWKSAEQLLCDRAPVTGVSCRKCRIKIANCARLALWDRQVKRLNAELSDQKADSMRTSCQELILRNALGELKRIAAPLPERCSFYNLIGHWWDADSLASVIKQFDKEFLLNNLNYLPAFCFPCRFSKPSTRRFWISRGDV